MIIATVRTRDEKRNIGRFCEAYQGIADKILVADGGSEDETIEIASSFPKVEIRDFEERTQLKDGHWRNNDSDHINFLISWANEYSPDWIIHDDCDCAPNYLLRQDARGILTKTKHNLVRAARIYLWGTDQHFPHMAKGKDKESLDWSTSLWAWRPEIKLLTVAAGPAYTLKFGAVPRSILELAPPLCLMHYSWDDEDIVEEKVKIYRDSGLIPGQLHPLEFAGPLESLPPWVREEE